MKEDIRRNHGVPRTKDLLAFDEGLAEKKAPFISVVRPLVSALQALQPAGDVSATDDDGEANRCPDLNHIN